MGTNAPAVLVDATGLLLRSSRETSPQLVSSFPQRMPIDGEVKMNHTSSR